MSPKSAVRVLAICCLAMLPAFARAQSRDLPQKAAAGSALNDLKAALPYVEWNSRTHGPLIAITPEKVRSGNLTSAEMIEAPSLSQPFYAPAENDTLDPDLVARRFRRKLVRLPTLSVFAPPKMTIIHTDLPPANPFRGAQVWDMMRRLEATLTPTQWQMLGSPTGLGFGDLTDAQQPIFDAALPEPMTIDREKTSDFGYGHIGTEIISGSERTLTPEQRQQVRLHLERKAQMYLVDEKNQGLPMVSPFHSEKWGAEKVGLVSTSFAPTEANILFGQAVREEVPNKLKPSDLDLKQALLTETWIPLTGVKTVGDLLKATSKVTGLDLRADDRLARLSVYLSTDARLVHASDLLEALCWSLTATYRKVGPIPGGDPKDFAYVLTYDRQGLAALRGRVSDWARRGEMLRYESSLQSDAALGKQKPARYVSFADGDVLAPTGDALLSNHAAQEDKSDGATSGQPTIPLSVLTAEQRQQMVDGLKTIDQMNQSNANRGDSAHPMTARTDRVSLYDSITVAYIVPGVGEVPSGSSWSDDALAPEFPPDDAARAAVRAANRAKRRSASAAAPTKNATPIALGKVIVGIAPATVADAELLLAAAPSLGVSEVWVSTANDADGRKLLAGCARSGAAHGVKVAAQVPLVRVPLAPDTTQEADATEDRNVFGETGAQWAAHFTHVTEGLNVRHMYLPGNYSDGRDLLAVEVPSARARIAASLQTVATLPGLAALVLRDIAAPGRRWALQTTGFGPSDWIGSEFGYTVADRLRFLRQSGYDPLDLMSRYSDQQVVNATMLPRFDSDTDDRRNWYSAPVVDIVEPLKAWDDFRARTERALLRDVRADLQTSYPDLTIYASSYETDNVARSYEEFQLWSDADAIPFDTAPVAVTTTPSRLSASGGRPAAPLHYFPLGAVFADVVQKSLPASPDLSVFGDAASYIRRLLSAAQVSAPPLAPTATSPPSPPLLPDVILDMNGISTANTVTFLRGMLPLLTGKK